MAVQRMYPDAESTAHQERWPGLLPTPARLMPVERAVWIFAVACTCVLGLGMPASASSRSSCAVFLDEVRGKADGWDADPVMFDLEAKLRISSPEQLIAAYGSLQTIGSSCLPGEIDPADPEEVMSPWDVPAYLDVAAGLAGATTWVQFIYPSIRSFGPGLASSIVFYDEAGRPKATWLVSEYHSWETTSVLWSVMRRGEILSCRQSIEFFLYDQRGDVIGELESPSRSMCEVTVMPYPWP